jgi:hypothetical protein
MPTIKVNVALNICLPYHTEQESTQRTILRHPSSHKESELLAVCNSWNVMIYAKGMRKSRKDEQWCANPDDSEYPRGLAFRISTSTILASLDSG